MEIGEKIRKLRADADMTQDELAAKLLVTCTAVSKWETGKGWPGVEPEAHSRRVRRTIYSKLSIHSKMELLGAFEEIKY